MHLISERIAEISHLSPDALMADGFDEAIIGWVKLADHLPPTVLYSYDICIEILMDTEGWDDEDAMEWMDYNVVNAYMGLGTPAFLMPDFEFEDGPFTVYRADGYHEPVTIRLFDEE